MIFSIQNTCLLPNVSRFLYINRNNVIINCFLNIFQDLPEHFEENMEKWMKNFLILLTIDNKQLNLEVLVYSFLILFVELSLNAVCLDMYELSNHYSPYKNKKQPA